MSVEWNPYIQQRGVRFAIRESGFGRGRQVATVDWAPGAMNSQRVSVAEFNRLLDSDNPTPPPPPASVRPWPYPSYGEVPVQPRAPTYVPAGPSPTTAFSVPVVTVTPAAPVAAAPKSLIGLVAPSGAIPTQSNFLVGERFSAQWGYHEGAINQTCATQGAAFLRALRSALNLTPGVVWDADIQNALIAQVLTLAASNPAAWAGTLLQLRNDLAAQRVSGLSLLVGIYAAYYAGHGRRLDAIEVPPNTVLPIWGRAPAPDGDRDGLVCFDPTLETADDPQGGVQAAIAESVTGIRVGAGRIVTGLGTVFDAPPISQGVGWKGFLAAAIGIGVVAWAVTPSDRQNPRPWPQAGHPFGRDPNAPKVPWSVLAKRHEFLAWATPPLNNGWVRYAVVRDAGHVIWRRYDAQGYATRNSGGAFYDGESDHPEGAVKWAQYAAKQFATKNRDV